MRRFIIGCSAAALLLVGGPRQFDGRSGDHPTDGAPAEGHPIVGAWLLTVDEFPDDPPELVAVHADGTYHESMPTEPPASGHGRQPDRPRST